MRYSSHRLPTQGFWNISPKQLAQIERSYCGQLHNPARIYKTPALKPVLTYDEAGCNCADLPISSGSPRLTNTSAPPHGRPIDDTCRSQDSLSGRLPSPSAYRESRNLRAAKTTRQLPQQTTVVFLPSFSAPPCQNQLLVTAVAADMHAPCSPTMLSTGTCHFLEHPYVPLAASSKRISLQGDNHQCPVRNVLRQHRLNVAIRRRHVQHQIIQIRPQRILQQLHQRLTGHRSAPP